MTEGWNYRPIEPARQATAVTADPRLQSIDLNPVLAMPEGQGEYAVGAVIEVAT